MDLVSIFISGPEPRCPGACRRTQYSLSPFLSLPFLSRGG